MADFAARNGGGLADDSLRASGAGVDDPDFIAFGCANREFGVFAADVLAFGSRRAAGGLAGFVIAAVLRSLRSGLSSSESEPYEVSPAQRGQRAAQVARFQDAPCIFAKRKGGIRNLHLFLVRIRRKPGRMYFARCGYVLLLSLLSLVLSAHGSVNNWAVLVSTSTSWFNYRVRSQPTA